MTNFYGIYGKFSYFLSILSWSRSLSSQLMNTFKKIENIFQVHIPNREGSEL